MGFVRGLGVPLSVAATSTGLTLSIWLINERQECIEQEKVSVHTPRISGQLDLSIKDKIGGTGEAHVGELCQVPIKSHFKRLTALHSDLNW